MSNLVQKYTAALQNNPNDLEALVALEAALTESESWATHPEIIGKYARGIRDLGQRARFLSRAAHIARHVNNDADRTIALVREILELGLDGDTLVESVLMAFAPTSDWNGYIACLMEVGQSSEDTAVAARCFHSMGRTYEDRLYNRERAITCYQRAFKLDPHFTEPLHAARAIYAHADQWSTVGKLYRIELKVTTEPRARARLLKELGYVEFERLNEKAAAVETLSEAARLDPDLGGLNTTIDRIRAELDVESGAKGVIVNHAMLQASDAVPIVPPDEVIERVPQSTVEAEVEIQPIATAEFSGARSRAEAIPEPDDVVAPRTPIAPTIDPNELSMVPVQSGIFEVAAEPVDAELGVEPAPEEAAQSIEEADIDSVVQRDTTGQERTVLVAVAPPEEDEDANAATMLPPDHGDDAMGVTLDSGSHEEVADDYIAESESRVASPVVAPPAPPAAPPTPPAAPPVQVATSVSTAVSPSPRPAARPAPAAPVPLPTPPRAQISASLPAVAAARPKRTTSGGAAAPIPAVEEHLDEVLLEARTARGAEALDLFAWALELGIREHRSTGEMADWVVEAAQSHDDSLLAFQRVFPAFVGDRAFCETIYERLFELDGADPDAGLAGALYGVLFYGLHQPDNAREYASRAGVWAALESAVLDPASKGNWRKAQSSLMEALAPNYGADAENESYRIQAYMAMGLDKDDKAIDSLRRLQKANKGDRMALTFLKTLYRKLERWPQLAETIKAETQILGADERVRRVVANRELIEIYRTHLNQPRSVVAAYNELIDADPSNLGYVDELCDLLRELNSPQELIAALRLKVDALTDVDEKIATHQDIASIFIERFSNQAEAIRSYEAILALDSRNLESLKNLEDLYDKRRQWAQLIDVKKRLVEETLDANEQARLLRDAADIATTRIRDTALASELWSQVLEVSTDDPMALEALERIYEKDKDWEKLAGVLARRVYIIPSDTDRAAALLKLGQIQADRLGDTAGSVQTYEDLLGIDPANLRAKDSLKKAYVELERWDSLEEFFRREGNWTEYVRQLEALAGSVSDPQTRVDLLFRAAEVWSGELKDEARSTKVLEKVLTIDERNQRAAAALAPICEARGDFKRLPAFLEIVLDHEEEPERRFDIVTKLARIASEKQRDQSLAYRWFAAAVEEQPHRIEILDEVEKSANDSNNLDSLVRRLSSARKRLAGDPTVAPQWLEMSLRLGRILDSRAGDPTGALAVFDEVLDQEPANLIALDAKDAIFTRLGDWDALLGVVEAKQDLVTDVASRIALLERICDIHETKRDDLDAAIKGYNDILAIDGENVLALEALHRLYRQTGEHAALADTLRSLVSHREKIGDVAGRRVAQIELAQVSFDQLGEFHGAVEIIGGVVQEEPSNVPARALLEKLLGVDEKRLDVARILEPLYEADQQWTKFVDILEIQVSDEYAADKAPELLSRIGHTYADRIGDLDGASDAFARLLRANPRSTEARERLESIAEVTGKWLPVVDLYEEVIGELSPGITEEKALAIELGEQTSLFYDQKLGRVEDSIRMQRRVLEIEPGRLASLEKLDDLFTRTSQWAELLGVCDERLGIIADPSLRRELQFKAARIWEEMLDQPTEAISEYRRILDSFPQESAALEALDRLLGATGDPLSQAEVIERRIQLDGTPAAERLAMKNRLARVYEDELGDVPRSMSLWSETLGEDASNAGALAGLEKQLANDDYAVAAADILEPYYLAQSLSEKLVNLLEIRLRHTHSDGDRKELYHRIATLHDKQLGASEQAYMVLTRAVSEYLGDAKITERLYGLAEQLNAFRELGDTLEALADESTDPVIIRDTLASVARIREEKVGDGAAAAVLWRRVLEETGADREALDALERLDQQSGDWAELVDILLRKADLPEISRDSAAVKPLLFRAASIYEEQLEKSEEAIEVLRRVLGIDSSDAYTIGELERLFTQTGRWEDLVENFGRRLSLAANNEEKRDLLFTLGPVLERELDDADRAVESYRQILGMFPSDLSALQALDRLYARTENWHELLGVLAKEVQLVDAPEQARDIRFRIGRLHEVELGDPHSAIGVYREILGNDSKHADTREALAAMVERGDESLAAAKILEPIYRAEGKWEKLIAIIRVISEFAETPTARREHFVDIAGIEETQLGNVEAAIVAYSEATAEECRRQELDQLERLAGGADAWERIGKLFADLWEDVSDPALRTELGLRVARIREENLGNVEAAIEAFARVHEEDGQVQTALESLDRLYERAANWEGLGDVLLKRIVNGGAANNGIELRLRLALLNHECLENSAEAVNVYREVLSLDEQNAEAVTALEQMVNSGVETFEISAVLDPHYRKFAMWQRLVALNETRIRTEESADERYRIWLDTADVQETHLADHIAALNSLGNALFERPSEIELKTRIELLGESISRWTLVAEIYAGLLKEELGDADRLDVALRLAVILRDHLSDVRGAEAAYLVALEVDPANVPSLQALDKLYTEQARFTDLVGILARLREAVYDQTSLIELAFRHANIYRDEIGDAESAIRIYHEVLELDPTHRASLLALERLYLAGEKWEPLFDIYERQAGLATDPMVRAEVTERMAVLATEKLERPNDAIDLWQSVLQVRPEDVNALANLSYLYEVTEQNNELADILDRQVELEAQPAHKVALLRRAGQLWSDVLANSDMAIARHVKILAIQTDDAQALHALRALYESVADFERLVDVLSRLLKIGEIPEAEQAGVYEQLGTIYQDTLSRPVDAIAAWNEVISRRPTDDDALDRLENLYIQEQRWEDCVGILERKVDRAEDPETKIELLKRIADLWQSRLAEQNNAAAAYERVLDLDRADFDAANALEAIYRATQNWESLSGLYLDRREVLSDPWERMETLKKAASIFENQLSRPDGAFLIIGKAVQEQPLDEELRGELERLGAAAGKEDDLIRIYSDLASRMANQEEYGEAATMPLLLAIGRIQDTRLGRPEMAEVYYDRALTIEPENEIALRALESIYERTADWQSLVGILKRRAVLTYDQVEQVNFYKRIGALHEEKTGDMVEAVESYKMVTRIDESDSSALASLERIYSATSQWRELVEVLSKQAESTYETVPLVALRYRIGTLWNEKLGVAERAIDAYREVLAIDPEYMPALIALEQLYARLDKWDKFLEIIETRLMLTQEIPERIRILAAQAMVHEKRFDDVDSAVDSLNQILQIDPRHLDSILSLERIFAEQERMSELVDTYERHIAAVETVEEKTEVLGLMARTYVENLDDVNQGIGTYQRILDLDPYHVAALGQLGALYESVEDFVAAVNMHERLARLVGDPDVRLRLVYRAGQLLELKVLDIDGAETRYNSCLELEPGFVDAMVALERIQVGRGNWTGALQMQQMQIESQRELRARAGIMVRMARIYGDHVGDLERAQHLFEEAIELDPQSSEAAGPLAQLFFQQSNWARTRPLLLLVLADETTERPDDESRDLWYQLGVVNEQLSFETEAIAAYERALVFDASHLGSELGLARLYSRANRLNDAVRMYEDVLLQHSARLDAKRVVECYYQAGIIKNQLLDPEGSKAMFISALEVDPSHGPSLRELLNVVTAAGDKRGIVEVKQRLLPSISDPLEQFKMLVDIGDGYLEFGSAAQAESAYRDAVKIDPNSKVVLHKLLNIFTESGNWRRATEVLAKLAQMEQDPDRHAKLCFTIAAIFRDELGDVDMAVQFFNQALDAKFDYLEAFQAIDHLLTSAKDWKLLEQNYRRMIGRVESDAPEHVELKVKLLENLGEIYRSRMQRFDDAIAAYKLASALKPTDEGLLTILAELVSKSGGTTTDVIEQHQRLIAVSPFRIESYRALLQAYSKDREFDKAWCMSSALSLLQKANPEEEEFYKRYLPPNVLKAPRKLAAEHWPTLSQPGMDPNLTTLFSIIAADLRPVYSRDIKQWGLNRKKDAIDLNQEMPFTQLVKYAVEQIGTIKPTVLEKAEHTGLSNANIDPPALIAGKDMLSGRSQRDLAFMIAKAITLMRPEFYLASAFPSTDALKVFFHAAWAATTGSVLTEHELQKVTDYAGAMRDIPRIPQLQRAIQDLQASGRNPDLSAWLRDADYTANRVGLLICGDLRTAVHCIKNEQLQIGKATIKDKVRELILFSISEEYFALRKDLGFALSPK